MGLDYLYLVSWYKGRVKEDNYEMAFNNFIQSMEMGGYRVEMEDWSEKKMTDLERKGASRVGSIRVLHRSRKTKSRGVS